MYTIFETLLCAHLICDIYFRFFIFHYNYTIHYNDTIVRMIRDKKMRLKLVIKSVEYIRCLVSTKWDSLFMDREFRAIGGYHHHLHLYLADCLTWRKLENTGYHPYLSTILRARIVGIACHVPTCTFSQGIILAERRFADWHANLSIALGYDPRRQTCSPNSLLRYENT